MPTDKERLASIEAKLDTVLANQALILPWGVEIERAKGELKLHKAAIVFLLLAVFGAGGGSLIGILG
jgi:hypothetical protein